MAIRKKSPSVEDLLVTEMTVGGDALDRELFYVMTKDMDAGRLAALEKAVGERVRGYYRDLHRDLVRRDGVSEDGPASLERDMRFVEGQLNSWFRPWTSLAGRIDDAISFNTFDRGKPLDGELLSTLCEAFSKLPEYRLYVDRELKGYVYNKCVDCYLDYTALPDGIRDDALAEKFAAEHPYLVGSREDELLGAAFELGGPRTMALMEKPSRDNGFIGGRVEWSRYLALTRCPVLSEGKATGIGHIDHETNAFVILDGGRRAVPFHSLDRSQRQVILEQVYWMRKARAAGQEKAHKRKADRLLIWGL